ncbi:hypothetical protein ACFL1G_09765 [Planctomycetota bacterium]
MATPEITVRELKLTAALYSKRSWIVSHVKETGKLPEEIYLGGACIGLKILLRERGTDIELTPDEQLVYDAIVAERRLPAGRAILVPDKPQRRKERSEE